ncbi:MAG TPA: hypothetical protein VM434_11045 [Beijerinckiaceae bacterium]|nr:hypothetical protein [Beijerinckiaceae bacterium]
MDEARRAERNRRACERLAAAALPAPVLLHARGLRFVPATASRAVEAYWRAHPVRADRLARALARRSGAPEGWTWRPQDGRRPPAPWREDRFALGPGRCCLCGQPVFRHGWHADSGAGPSRRARWHLVCVAAWKLWNAPQGHARALKRLQGGRCAETGARLLRTAEIDHRIPLYRVRRDHRDLPWPDLLAFWGVPNLRVVNRAAHVAKCAAEAAERASGRRSVPVESGVGRLGVPG